MINDGNAKLLAPCSLETLRNEQSDEILLNKVTMGQVEIRHHAIGVFSVKRFFFFFFSYLHLQKLTLQNKQITLTIPTLHTKYILCVYINTLQINYTTVK